MPFELHCFLLPEFQTAPWSSPGLKARFFPPAQCGRRHCLILIFECFIIECAAFCGEIVVFHGIDFVRAIGFLKRKRLTSWCAVYRYTYILMEAFNISISSSFFDSYRHFIAPHCFESSLFFCLLNFLPFLFAFSPLCYPLSICLT